MRAKFVLIKLLFRQQTAHATIPSIANSLSEYGKLSSLLVCESEGIAAGQMFSAIQKCERAECSETNLQDERGSGDSARGRNVLYHSDHSSCHYSAPQRLYEGSPDHRVGDYLGSVVGRYIGSLRETVTEQHIVDWTVGTFRYMGAIPQVIHPFKLSQLQLPRSQTGSCNNCEDQLQFLCPYVTCQSLQPGDSQSQAHRGM